MTGMTTFAGVPCPTYPAGTPLLLPCRYTTPPYTTLYTRCSRLGPGACTARCVPRVVLGLLPLRKLVFLAG